MGEGQGSVANMEAVPWGRAAWLGPRGAPLGKSLPSCLGFSGCKMSGLGHVTSEGPIGPAPPAGILGSPDSVLWLPSPDHPSVTSPHCLQGAALSRAQGSNPLPFFQGTIWNNWQLPVITPIQR